MLEKLLSQLKYKFPINPNDWRYTVAQVVLSILYGHRQQDYYISPWKHAAVSVGALLIHDGKILTGKRGQMVEYAGKRGLIGGHINFETHEKLLQGLQREVKEETNIDIDTSKLDVCRPLAIIESSKSNYFELKNAHNICFYYIYHLSTQEVSQLKDSQESFDYKFLSVDDLYALSQHGDVLPMEWVFDVKDQIKASIDAQQ